MDHFAVAINELQLVDKLGGFHFNGSDGSVFGELERLIDISESTNLPWYLTITQCKSKARYLSGFVHQPLNFLQSQCLQRLFALRAQLHFARPALNWRFISATPHFTLPDWFDYFLVVGHHQTILCFILLDVLLELLLELLDELLIIRLKSGFLLLTAQDLVFILILDLSETVTKHTREGHLVGSESTFTLSQLLLLVYQQLQKLLVLPRSDFLLSCDLHLICLDFDRNSLHVDDQRSAEAFKLLLQT